MIQSPSLTQFNNSLTRIAGFYGLLFLFTVAFRFIFGIWGMLLMLIGGFLFAQFYMIWRETAPYRKISKL